ncbi:Sec-independent protein translocase protein TatB [Methylomonas sp. AM2-LC]|uniref:Sec-independent protein translocase protein TatB n=1 Tax=Methylomonas sp. AM2-LC TaxID=3153301 RepID=UPI003265CAED
MFDVGFSEIVMVGLVALLVIGPEKLPKAARIAGFWIGKTRSTIATVKAEIQHELHAEEMRQMLKQQIANQSLQETIDATETAISEINTALETLSTDTHKEPIDDQSNRIG